MQSNELTQESIARRASQVCSWPAIRLSRRHLEQSRQHNDGRNLQCTKTAAPLALSCRHPGDEQMTRSLGLGDVRLADVVRSVGGRGRGWQQRRWKRVSVQCHSYCHCRQLRRLLTFGGWRMSDCRLGRTFDWCHRSSRCRSSWRRGMRCPRSQKRIDGSAAAFWPVREADAGAMTPCLLDS